MRTDAETETSADTERRETPAPVTTDDALRPKRIAARSGLRAGLATTLAAGSLEGAKRPPADGE